MVYNFQIKRKIANDTACNYSVGNPLSAAIVIGNQSHYAEL